MSLGAGVDCRTIYDNSTNVMSGNMDGCHGYDWGGSRYVTPALEPDQVIIGLQLMHNGAGLCQLAGIIVCSILKLDDPSRVISLVRTTDGFGNIVTVGNTNGSWTNTGDSFMLPVGYALTSIRQLSCNKIRQIWLNGTNFAMQKITIGPVTPVMNTGNVNGNASPLIVAGGAFGCITRIEWNYRGDPENGSNGLTGIPTIYWKEFNAYRNDDVRAATVAYENYLAMTKANKALKKFSSDYFGTDSQRDNFSDNFCPSADLSLPENSWCSCYLSRNKVLADPTLMKRYPLAKYTTQPQCWNESCLTAGYKNAGIRSAPSCPSLTICTQDLASISGANNVLNNVLLTQDCSTSVTNKPPSGGTTGGSSSGTTGVSTGTPANPNTNSGEDPKKTTDSIFSSIYVWLFLIFIVAVIIFSFSGKSSNDRDELSNE